LYERLKKSKNNNENVIYIKNELQQ